MFPIGLSACGGDDARVELEVLGGPEPSAQRHPCELDGSLLYYCFGLWSARGVSVEFRFEVVMCHIHFVKDMQGIAIDQWYVQGGVKY
jgi:hypothetical protein